MHCASTVLNVPKGSILTCEIIVHPALKFLLQLYEAQLILQKEGDGPSRARVLTFNCV